MKKCPTKQALLSELKDANSKFSVLKAEKEKSIVLNQYVTK